ASDPDVRPGDVVELSAFSTADATTCTTDPEDQRVALTYAWSLTSAPPGPAPALSGETTPTPRFVPLATGTYQLRLTVRDYQSNAATADLTLLVAVKHDLVAQLSWSGFSQVDLDVHLVRPG